MSDVSRVRDSFARTEQELREEQAAALRRIAGTLERLVARLAAIRMNLDGASGAERAHQARAYGAVAEKARLYRWYLEVQREALGLRRHDVLDSLYPIPDLTERLAAER